MQSALAEGQNHIRIEMHKDNYGFQETITIRPVIVNLTDGLLTYTMAYVGQVFNTDNTLVWEKEMVAYGKITIPANAERSLDQFFWDQKDKTGKQVPPGRYRIFIRLFEYRFKDVNGQKWITIR